MLRFFVPYTNEKPASINIKGHTLVLVSTEEQDVLKGLPFFGANRVEEVQVEDSQSKQDVFLNTLAESIHGGVVLAPPGVDIDLVLEGLESELPWMH